MAWPPAPDAKPWVPRLRALGRRDVTIAQAGRVGCCRPRVFAAEPLTGAAAEGCRCSTRLSKRRDAALAPVWGTAALIKQAVLAGSSLWEAFGNQTLP